MNSEKNRPLQGFSPTSTPIFADVSKKKKTLGVCLSGGAARGVAHMGFLQALDEHHIVPKAISGCSAGAIVAAFYASGVTPLEMLSVTKKQSLFKIYQLNFSLRGLTSLDHLKKLMGQHMRHENFEDLPTQLHVGVSNLNKGAFELFNKGSIVPAVMASCAIPVLFEPVRINGELYADGGIMNNLPAEVLLDACDVVVGVDVNGIQPIGKMQHVIKVGERSLHMLLHQNAAERLRLCHLPISLEKTSDFHFWDLSKAQELFDVGYEAGLSHVQSIEKLLSSEVVA